MIKMAAIKEFIATYDSYINIAAGVAIFLIFTALRKKLASFVLEITGRIIFSKYPQRLQGYKNSLMHPVAIYFSLVGLFCGIMLNYNHTIIKDTFKIASVLVACWCIISFISENLVDYLGTKSGDPKVNGIAVKFVSNLLKALTVCIAIVMVISELGYNINGLLTGLGVGGLAVSLAAQDSLKSMISGFVIMFDKPFDVGDFIETSEFSGTVEDITMRSTRVRKLDDTIVAVPNTKLADSLITNYAKLTKRLVEFKIGLLYSTSADVLKKCKSEIYDFLNNHEKVESETIRVRFCEYEESALNLQIRCYISITNLEEYYAFVEELNFAIKEIIENNDTDFAYPTQSIHIEYTNGEAK